MKLLNMHVDNFGGLHNYDFVFEDGLNVVLHENGWGKTTMAAFLKAMLYGFDSKRSKSITENERKRYLPWQGGIYGGYLEFEAEGIPYRIYRTFGETPRFDKTKIINLNTNKAANINAENIGETLFGLDANAFQRSAFINQNGLSVEGAASSIHTRLNALISQANDVSAYDDAIANLTSQMKVYEKTGGRGRIGEITRKISELENQRSNLDAIISKQDEARERISQLNVLISALDEDLKKKKAEFDKISGKAKKAEASKELLNQISAQISQLQEQISALKSDLGNKLPTKAEIDQLKQKKQTLDILSSQKAQQEKDIISLTQGYEALLKKYNNVLPTTAQLDEIQSIYAERQGILSTSDTDSIATEEAPDGYYILQKATANNPEYLSKLQEAINLQASLQQLLTQLEHQNRDISQESSNWTEKKKRYSDMLDEATKLRAKLDNQTNEQNLEAVISDLEKIQKTQNELSSKQENINKSIERENSDREALKKRYTALCQEEKLLTEFAKSKEKYNTNCVEPKIKQLESILQAQQLIKLKQDDLDETVTTPEQENALKRFGGDLPSSNEGEAILKQYKSNELIRAEISRLSVNAEAIRIKLDNLSSQIDKLKEEKTLTPTNKPKKPAFGAMFAVGGIIAAISIALAVAINPLLSLVAIVSCCLFIAGAISNTKYKKNMQAYEKSYQEALAKQAEESKKLADLNAQLTEAANTAKESNQKYDAQMHALSEGEKIVKAWTSKWMPNETEINEKSILHVLDLAEDLRKLQKKQEQNMQTRSFIQKQNLAIATSRADVDAQYPELVGKSHEITLNSLRTAEKEYIIATEKATAATENIKSFLAEANVSAEELMQDISAERKKLQVQLEEVNSSLEAQSAKRRNLDEQYPEISNLTNSDAIELLRKKHNTYVLLNSQLQTAQKNIDNFIKSYDVSAEQLNQEVSPQIEKLYAQKNDTEASLSNTIKEIEAVLSVIDIKISTDDPTKALRQAEKITNAYLRYNELYKGYSERQLKKQQQLSELQEKLDEKSTVLQLNYADMEIPARVSNVRKDIAEAERLIKKQKDIEAQIQAQTQKSAATSTEIELFIASYGHFSAETEDILNEIFSKANDCAEKEATLQQLQNQYANISNEQAKMQESSGSELTELKKQISEAEEQRDNWIIEYTKKNDFIRQIDQSLNIYPDIIIELRQQYKLKLKAQQALSMLKRTIQLITTAKENLANRYLSKVEDLFNNYMHIWLNNDAVKGILDIDFNVVIEEDQKTHVAEGYSTGYCDLIDFCMRLALVDTLFANEQPFLILDDPFVNLDAEHLEKALELLNVMSASKQIIYFVCHPIRAVEMDGDSESRKAFVELAMATRATLENRKSVEKSTKPIIRKSLIELYKTVDTGTPLSLHPEKPDYVITNNIFSLTFLTQNADPNKEYNYELFFIDEKGRVLNDRVLVEIKNGSISLPKICFCLNTYEDSGKQYELMIQESGQGDYEVVARIPFSVKLSFAGTDSFGF